VLQKAADKLLGREGHGFPPRGPGVPVAQADLAIVVGLMAVAFRATAVAAGVVDVVLLTTVLARQQLPAQRLGPAGEQIRHGPAMAGQQIWWAAPRAGRRAWHRGGSSRHMSPHGAASRPDSRSRSSGLLPPRPPVSSRSQAVYAAAPGARGLCGAETSRRPAGR
jgi:hypothetical protein